MDLETLIKTCYEDTLPNKLRSTDSVRYQTHIERNLIALLDEINDRRIRPSAYSFIIKHPKPREVFAGDVGMRITQHFVLKRITEYIEDELTPFSFSNRKGMGSQAAVNQVISNIYEVSRGFTNDNCWIIKVDMQGYFPNASQDIAYKQMEAAALRYEGEYRDDLLYMLRSNIYSYPTLNSYRKSTLDEWKLIEPSKSLYNKNLGQGGVIGHPVWQYAMVLYMNGVIKWMGYWCGMFIVVYMDDIVIVTNNKAATLAMMPELRRRLAEIGVTLHPKKFYCQHYTKGVEFVGYHIKKDRVYINNRCRNNAMKSLRSLNRYPCEAKIDAFISTVNSYLGRFKQVNGYKIVQEYLHAIAEGWWVYIEYDKNRICIRPRDGYKPRQRIINRYNLQSYEKRRNRKRNQQGSTENP